MVVGSGDASGGDMLIMPLPVWLTGEWMPVGLETGGIDGATADDSTCDDGGGGGGPPLVVLEKLDPVGWSMIMSTLMDRLPPQSSRSRPSRMRRSTDRALVGWAMILKKEMVLEKSSPRSCPPTNRPRVGSRNTAERVSKLPHWL